MQEHPATLKGNLLPDPTTNLLFCADSTTVYEQWPSPDTIISDGAYGISGFPGDPRTPVGLAEWYRPHVEAWTAAATSSTALWFWNTEVGWANVHPLLVEHDWQYVQLVTWDKGISHVAGNVNGDTIRRFPVVTEVTALYVRRPTFSRDEEGMTVQDWLRAEWFRTGLPMSQANVACGVANAASRKWLTADHNWYMPPMSALQQMRAYANEHGNPKNAPFFVLPDEMEEGNAWQKLRNVWNHQHGLTNVWQHLPVRGSVRLKGLDGQTLHANQKPEALIRRQLEATTNPGGVVWEPFAGTGTVSVVAKKMGRSSYGAEMAETYFAAASARLSDTLPDDTDLASQK